MKTKFDNFYKDMMSMITESGLSRLHQKINKHTCGTITAFRGEKSYAENTKNNKKILAYLQSKGYSVTGIQGTYIENFQSEGERHVNEQSFFVCNHNVNGDDNGELKNDLIKLGELFDQDSILIIPVGGSGAYLYGTSRRDDAYPSYGESEVVGKGRFGKVAGEFLSKIKGREFAFEDIEKPGTINGIRGRDILLKEIKRDLEK